MTRPDDRLPPGTRRGFRLPFTSARRARQDVDDELDFHFQMAVDELQQAGHPPESARRLARERFGSRDLWQERILSEDHRTARRTRRIDRISGGIMEFRGMVRALVAAPVFTLGIVLTVAIGIGANATMVAVVDRLMLRAPDGVVSAAEVRRISWQRRSAEGQVHDFNTFSYPQYSDFRDRVPALQDVAAYAVREIVSGEGVDAVPARGALVTGNYFSTLGIRPLLGRLLMPADAEPGSAGTVAVISYSMWQRDFGGRTDVIGATIRLAGQPMTVVGVLPDGIGSLELQRIDSWLPMSVMAHLGRQGWELNRNNRWLRIVGRVADGVTPAELNQQLTNALLLGEREAGRSEEAIAAAGITGTGRGIQPGVGSNESATVTVAGLLAGMSVVLLLIACANVANLLLVRSMRRERELAVRVALGVSPRRLVTSALAESLLLAVAGGVVAYLVSSWGSSVVRTLLLPEMVWPDTLLDGRAMLFTSAAVVFTALVAGLAPALRSVRVDVLPALQGGSRGGVLRPSRFRSALVVVQGALCVLLLVGAGLFVRSLHNARNLDLGFNPDQVALVSLPLSSSAIPMEEWESVAMAARDATARVPGVLSVARTNSVPRWTTYSFGISVPGLDSIPLDRGYPLMHAVSEDYFRVMGVRLTQGRLPTTADRDANLLVVNDAAEQLLWPGESAIGKCIRLGDEDTLPCHRVIGVVADSRWEGVSEPTPIQVYAPADAGSLLLLARTSTALEAGAASFARSLRAAALQADARLTWADVQPLEDIVAPDYRSWELGATMFTVFGGLALLLAGVGLYSVVSYTAAQRRHEMAIRLALGTSRANVMQVVVKQGVTRVAVGVGIGVVAVLLFAAPLERLLFNIAPRDPVVLLGTTVALLLVAVLACLVPAAGAARVNPADILRSD